MAACFIRRFLQLPLRLATGSVASASTTCDSEAAAKSQNHLVQKAPFLLHQGLQIKDAATLVSRSIGVVRAHRSLSHTSAEFPRTDIPDILFAPWTGPALIGVEKSVVLRNCGESDYQQAFSKISLPVPLSSAAASHWRPTNGYMDDKKAAADVSLVRLPARRGNKEGSPAHCSATAGPSVTTRTSLILRGTQAKESLVSAAKAQAWARAFS